MGPAPSYPSSRASGAGLPPAREMRPVIGEVVRGGQDVRPARGIEIFPVHDDHPPAPPPEKGDGPADHLGVAENGSVAQPGDRTMSSAPGQACCDLHARDRRARRDVLDIVNDQGAGAVMLRARVGMCNSSKRIWSRVSRFCCITSRARSGIRRWSAKGMRIHAHIRRRCQEHRTGRAGRPCRRARDTAAPPSEWPISASTGPTSSPTSAQGRGKTAAAKPGGPSRPRGRGRQTAPPGSPPPPARRPWRRNRAGPAAPAVSQNDHRPLAPDPDREIVTLAPYRAPAAGGQKCFLEGPRVRAAGGLQKMVSAHRAATAWRHPAYRAERGAEHPERGSGFG